jgi:transposase
MLTTLIAQLTAHIREIEREIKRLIDSNSEIASMLVLSIPGVGLLLASNLLVISRGFSRLPEARQLASYLGICPHEHTSGTSVYRRPRSSGFGPPRMRKLLHLSSMSLRCHDARFGQYFARKCAEGKPPRLVLNNIANKLVRIICGVMRSGTPYSASYRSVHPRFAG